MLAASPLERSSAGYGSQQAYNDLETHPGRRALRRLRFGIQNLWGGLLGTNESKTSCEDPSTGNS